MKKPSAFLVMLLLFVVPFTLQAATSLNLKSHYTETINKNGLTKDVVKDYGMKSSDSVDQSEKLQNAIDDIANNGGGSLIIPKGTYCFAYVTMASNVHILVDKDAVLKPYIENPFKSIIMLQFSNKDENDPKYIENCSIRAIQDGEQFTVDYSDCDTRIKVRFMIVKMVKNFLISDVMIKDNFTTHCGIVFVPTGAKGAEKWELSRPTFGEIRDCSILHGRAGYGLCQLHGAQTLYFENIYSNGGVTLRLESGAGGEHAGVFDISAKTVITENGRSAVMMNPHATVNGTVKIEDVISRGSGIAVLVHGGFVDRKHQHIEGAKAGVYANDCEIVNITATYGEEGQVDEKQVFLCEPEAAEYAKFKFNHYGDPKSFIAPSLAPVLDCTNGNYTVTYKNIKTIGFPKQMDYVVYEHDIEDRKKANRDIIAALPVMKNGLPASHKKTAEASKEKQAQQKKSNKAKAERQKTKK